MDAGMIIAVLGTSIAVVYDLRSRRIPNIIPAAMLLVSLPLATLGGHLAQWTLNTFIAAAIFYLFWMLRVWAAGDSKLLIGIAALMPQYPTALLPQPAYGSFFFLTVLFNLLLVYLLHTIFLILKRPQARFSFALVTASAAILFAAAYDHRFAAAVPFLFSFLVYRIYSEAAKLDLTQTVPVSCLVAGDNLAERIAEEDGVVIREREGRASLSSLLRRLRGDEGSSSPAPHGLTAEERDRLRLLVASGRIADGIRVYRGTIISPMILAALVLSAVLGDVLSVMI